MTGIDNKSYKQAHVIAIMTALFSGKGVVCDFP